MGLRPFMPVIKNYDTVTIVGFLFHALSEEFGIGPGIRAVYAENGWSGNHGVTIRKATPCTHKSR